MCALSHFVLCQYIVFLIRVNACRHSIPSSYVVALDRFNSQQSPTVTLACLPQRKFDLFCPSPSPTVPPSRIILLKVWIVTCLLRRRFQSQFQSQSQSWRTHYSPCPYYFPCSCLPTPSRQTLYMCRRWQRLLRVTLRFRLPLHFLLCLCLFTSVSLDHPISTKNDIWIAVVDDWTETHYQLPVIVA